MRGADKASKDRPCAIVVAAKREEDGDIRTIVAPIAREPLANPQASISFSPAICRKLGLDGDRY